MKCLILISFLLAAAMAAPRVHTSRQSGDLNVRADLKDVSVFALIPEGDLPEFDHKQTVEDPVEEPEVNNYIKEAKQDQEVDSGLLLLGALEQCAPDQYRDSEGVCQLKKNY